MLAELQTLRDLRTNIKERHNAAALHRAGLKDSNPVVPIYDATIERTTREVQALDLAIATFEQIALR